MPCDDLLNYFCHPAIGCQPTKSYRKGDILPSKLSSRVADTGAWILKGSEGDVGALEMKVSRLLDRVPAELAAWEALKGFYGNVFCGVFLNDWNRGLSLSPELMQRLVKYRLSIDFDLYCDVAVLAEAEVAAKEEEPRTACGYVLEGIRRLQSNNSVAHRPNQGCQQDPGVY